MLKRIAVTEVRLGMYIHELCGSWMDHPFWRARWLLHSEHDRQRILKSNVTTLWIDTSKGQDTAQGQASNTLEEVEVETEARLLAVDNTELPPLAGMTEELSRALKLCARSKVAIVEMFNEARMGQAINLEHVAALVEEVSDSVLRHPNALISLARLKTSAEYTYMHSVAVCALMIALARQLGLSADQVREAGLAGLLHDNGKVSIPDAILNKPDKLTDAEFSIMRSHPRAGGRMLLKSRQVSALTLDVCLHHHEKVDGSGYPYRLVGEQISLFARMGAVCDVYDAITSERPYKRGWDPAIAIRKMAEWKGHFDDQVFQAFVKSVGIYPVGALVRLESGRLGVIMEQHKSSLLTPMVKVFFSTRTKMPIAQELVDLSKLAGRDKIVGRESASDWGFKNIEELWSGLPASKRSHFD